MWATESAELFVIEIGAYNISFTALLQIVDDMTGVVLGRVDDGKDTL